MPRPATLLAVLLILAVGCQNAGGADHREKVTIKGETFKLELAADTPSRTKGLMGRTSLDPDGGMLFVFPYPGPLSFWMKDCLVDIDVIFLDSRGRITAIHRMKKIPPQGDDESDAAYEDRARVTSSYPSRLPAQFAIELKAGTLDRLKLNVQDKIELDLRRLKAKAK